MLAATESPSRSAWLLRSSGHSPTPARTAAPTDPGRRRRPPTVTVPASARRAPNTVSRISDRPAPTRPASPTTSPARTSKLTPANSPVRVSASTCSTAAAPSGTPGRGGNAYSIARPVISRMISAVGVCLAGRPVATVRPSLSTVTRSPMVRISSSRCEM